MATIDAHGYDFCISTYHVLYASYRRGGLWLLVLTVMGNLRASKSGASNGYRLHAFFVYVKNLNPIIYQTSVGPEVENREYDENKECNRNRIISCNSVDGRYSM